MFKNSLRTFLKQPPCTVKRRHVDVLDEVFALRYPRPSLVVRAKQAALTLEDPNVMPTDSLLRNQYIEDLQYVSQALFEVESVVPGDMLIKKHKAIEKRARIKVRRYDYTEILVSENDTVS